MVEIIADVEVTGAVQGCAGWSGKTCLARDSILAAERPGTVILLSTGYAELPSEARSNLPRLSKPFDQVALAKTIEAAMREGEHTGSVVAFRPMSA